MIQVLLAHGADPDLLDAQGNTALDLARSVYKTAAVQLLSRVDLQLAVNGFGERITRIRGWNDG